MIIPQLCPTKFSHLSDVDGDPDRSTSLNQDLTSIRALDRIRVRQHERSGCSGEVGRMWDLWRQTISVSCETWTTKNTIAAVPWW